MERRPDGRFSLLAASALIRKAAAARRVRQGARGRKCSSRGC